MYEKSINFEILEHRQQKSTYEKLCWWILDVKMPANVRKKKNGVVTCDWRIFFFYRARRSARRLLNEWGILSRIFIACGGGDDLVGHLFTAKLSSQLFFFHGRRTADGFHLAGKQFSY